MSKKISYENDNDTSKNECCDLDGFPEDYAQVLQVLKHNENSSFKDLNSLVDNYNIKLAELKNTRTLITNTKYTKDNLLLEIINNTNAPRYLKCETFNYKAIVLYFMRNFTNSKKIVITDLDKVKEESHSTKDLYRTYFKNKDFISINTHLDTLLHLINIDKYLVQENKILEQMIYNTLEYGMHVKNESLFKAKVAALPWIIKTLDEPDLIFGENSIIAEHLKFTMAFVRKTGRGTSREKYMYHIVGLKRLKDNRYTIVSQFPIEKDKNYSTGIQKVSQLHNYVRCDEPLYIKKGISIPEFSTDKVNENSRGFNKLKYKLES